MNNRLLCNFEKLPFRKSDFLERTGGFCLKPFRTLFGYTYTYNNYVFALKEASTTDKCIATAALILGCMVTIPMTIIGFVATWGSDSHFAIFAHFTQKPEPDRELEGILALRDNVQKEAAKVTLQYYNALKDRPREEQREIIKSKHESILINMFRNYALSTNENEPTRAELRYISECYFEYYPGVTFDNHGYKTEEIHIISTEFAHCQSVKEAMNAN